MKLQINVSDEFAKFTEDLVQFCKEHQPNELELLAPRSANQIIPLALVRVAVELGCEVPDTVKSEAALILVRKPGPQKKKVLESHDLFDERPGTWLSNVAIATGCAMVICGEKTLSLDACYSHLSASTCAIGNGWGAIPETKETSNGPMPGIRFIPPGADLVPKSIPAPAPMTLADVGAWISEASIFRQSTLVLSDGRTVQSSGSGVPEDAILIPQATEPSIDPIPDNSPEPLKIAHKNAITEARRHAIMRSIATAQVAAYELGWTMRRETRKSAPGILFIPPRIKLTYEIAPGRAIPVTQ